MQNELSKVEKNLIQSVVSDLSPNGGRRSILLVGKDRTAKPVIDATAKSLLERQEKYLWMDFDGRVCRTPNDWMSCLARNLRAGKVKSNKELGLFAREMGRLLTPFSSSTEEETDQSEQEKNTLLEKVLKLCEKYFSFDEKGKEYLTPVLSFSNLNDFSDSMLLWMSTELNSSLRKSHAFKNARFVFTSPSPNKQVADFFNRFGFEKILRYIIPGITKPSRNEKEKKALPQPVTKGLKKNMKSDKVVNLNMGNSGNSGLKNTNDFSSYSEKHQRYLILASLPTLINRYTLEFFCDARESAFCYNWLIRQNSLVKTNPDGFLILNENIKEQARAALKESDTNAEQKEVLASVLDAFMKIFPDPETHWIPVNLQMLSSFTDTLLEQILDSVDYAQVQEFLSQHPDHFISENNFHNLSDDAKMVTRRLMELSGLEPIEGLRESVENKWQEKQVRISERKSKIEGKKSSLEQEIEDIKEQITHFDQMRNQIDDQFQNPSNYKARKVYTFSTALPLLVIGLATIGVSLFSESIGTYHAACGLFLTFAGFFWPNIEIQKPDLQTVGGKPKLAVETQRRSLNHRISGLVNRASSLKGTLSDLDSELETLELGTQTPYLA